MKVAVIFLLVVTNYTLCYSQQQNKDLEAIRKEVIGTWRQADSSVIKCKYHFTSKKLTYTIFCPNSTILKRTVSYSLRKEYLSEFNREVVTVVIQASAKKLASHDCDWCREKTLKHASFYDWLDISISNNKLTSCDDPGNQRPCLVLIKE